jgi:hypothetical protein
VQYVSSIIITSMIRVGSEDCWVVGAATRADFNLIPRSASFNLEYCPQKSRLEAEGGRGHDSGNSDWLG